MKYIVKNRKTGEETLCEKVEVGGFDYYYSKEIHIEKGVMMYNSSFNSIVESANDTLVNCKLPNGNFCAKVIATNNPSLDLPQVVDELNISQYSRQEHKKNHPLVQEMGFALGIMVGYDKAKETYQFTKEDMIKFKQQAPLILEQLNGASDLDLFEIWQEQRTKTIIVE